MLATIELGDVEVLPPIGLSEGRYDAFDADGVGDEKVEVTRRGLVRLAIACTGVGARYEREGLAGHPAEWLLAPRRLFDGECGLDACVDLAPLRRCVALHAPGTSFGLDADPEAIDDLLADDAEETAAASREPPRRRSSWRADDASASSSGRATGRTGPRLWSCSLMRAEPGARVMTFVAGVAPDERDFRRRLFERFGAMAALSPDVRVGFDQYDPVAVTLVSEQLADWLATVAAEPFRCGETDFEVVVEHRIRA